MSSNLDTVLYLLLSASLLLFICCLFLLFSRSRCRRRRGCYRIPSCRSKSDKKLLGIEKKIGIGDHFSQMEKNETQCQSTLNTYRK